MHTPIVILGSGYTGSFVAAALSSASRSFFATSRAPQRHLAHIPEAQRVRFDLARSETWPHLPRHADLLWCFPAAPLELVQQFAAAVPLASHRLVVLASASAYDVGDSADYPPPWIDETAPLDLTKPRVRGEEFLRKECGAIILRVAGIYGPGRNPLDWVRSGRVGPSRKYVNLIHVEDLAASCLAALDRGASGEIYNVSDGTPRTWEDICAVAQARWAITPPTASGPASLGKRLATEKLTQQLGVSIRHPDLQAELAHLERETADR